MPIDFQLQERLVGFSLTKAGPGEKVAIATTELIGPEDPSHLTRRLEAFEAPLFSKIPGLPARSQIDHLLVIIRPDLTATAYFNELKNISAQVRLARDVEAGSLVFLNDVEDITAVDLGVEISNDAGVIFLRSFGWRRSLFFDLQPLRIKPLPRDFPMERALAQQALRLIGLVTSSSQPSAFTATSADRMEQGLAKLISLLEQKCEAESEYQEVLRDHQWMLGGMYSSIERHSALNDENVPDFTAVRIRDGFRDIIELKSPFIQCFRKDGEFTSGFNEAWNQAERYLSLSQRQRSYLAEVKELRFENPFCILLIGYNLTDAQLQQIRAKEGLSRVVQVFTYDQVVTIAKSMLNLVRSAGDCVVAGSIA